MILGKLLNLSVSKRANTKNVPVGETTLGKLSMLHFGS
jgi:hypothetical protein